MSFRTRFIRQSAGLGKRPGLRADADRYEHSYDFCDLLVAGGGISGLQAALVAGIGRGRG